MLDDNFELPAVIESALRIVSVLSLGQAMQVSVDESRSALRALWARLSLDGMVGLDETLFTSGPVPPSGRPGGLALSSTVRHGDSRFGVIQVCNRPGAEFGEHAPAALEILAAHTGVAISNCLANSTTPESPFAGFELDGLRISHADRRVTMEGRPVRLTTMEYRLLCELCSHAGEVVPSYRLCEALWWDDRGGVEQCLRTLVKDLRAKLGDPGRAPRYILTVRGAGYMVPARRSGSREP